MFKRCLLIAMRNPETLIQSTVTPFFLMVLFANVFGGIADIEGFNYIDFIVPGIILQAVAQASAYSAINVSSDMTKGIVDRFRSMPVSRASVLLGHIGAGVVRNMITTSILIGTAFIVGFRPQAGFAGWLVASGLLMLIITALSLLAVLGGLISKSPEGANGFMFPLFILPFISSGFAPVETMPLWLKWFAEYQPMTPVIDGLRGLMLGMPTGNSLWLGLAWAAGTVIITFTAAVQIFKRKTS